MEMGGPIGHLVRALGGDVEAADMIERMEAAEGLDHDDDEEDEDRVPGEYVEEDDEEGMFLSVNF